VRLVFKVYFVKLFLNPNGRIGRKDFWIGVGVLLALNLVLSKPLVDYRNYWILISTYLSFCVYGKRLHDYGRSAGLALLFFGFLSAFVALMYVAARHEHKSHNIILAGFLQVSPFVIPLLWLVWVTWLGTRKSDPNDNKYGHGEQGLNVAETFD
jgi:uncharacterized membrane protein YhaH (DUF805 family)